MKTEVGFDLDTLQFLLRLKALNNYWYEWLLMCAKTSPKVARMAINEVEKNLKYEMLKAEKVNVFQICKAVNSGNLEADAFRFTSNYQWQQHLNQVLAKIRKDGGF